MVVGLWGWSQGMKFWKTIKNFVRIKRVDASAAESFRDIVVVENLFMC